jgi:hypothetical protein
MAIRNQWDLTKSIQFELVNSMQKYVEMKQCTIHLRKKLHVKWDIIHINHVKYLVKYLIKISVKMKLKMKVKMKVKISNKLCRKITRHVQ